MPSAKARQPPQRSVVRPATHRDDFARGVHGRFIHCAHKGRHLGTLAHSSTVASVGPARNCNVAAPERHPVEPRAKAMPRSAARVPAGQAFSLIRTLSPCRFQCRKLPCRSSRSASMRCRPCSTRPRPMPRRRKSIPRCCSAGAWRPICSRSPNRCRWRAIRPRTARRAWPASSRRNSRTTRPPSTSSRSASPRPSPFSRRSTPRRSTPQPTARSPFRSARPRAR